MRNIKVRLILMSFLEFAIWGAYLTSMGAYLAGVGQAENIGWFYAVQGIVSLFMPALIGVIADRYMPAQKVLGLCHLLAGLFMCAAGVYGMRAGASIQSIYIECRIFYAYDCNIQFSRIYSIN